MIRKYRIEGRKEAVPKKTNKIIANITKDFTFAVKDESIFIDVALTGRIQASPGKLLIITVTGSHQRTRILTMDGKQLFRQYKTSQHSFLSYLQQLKRKFHKLIGYLDRVPSQHCCRQKVKAYLERNNDTIIVEYLQKGSADLSAVEECGDKEKMICQNVILGLLN